jgi:CheY-like chemotaxis protein
VTDLQMPNMSGDELARALKRLRPAQRILAITGQPSLAKLPEFDSILRKPFSPSELLGEVRGLF